MVMVPANTGKDNNSKIAVIKTDQTNKGVSWNKPNDKTIS